MRKVYEKDIREREGGWGRGPETGYMERYPISITGYMGDIYMGDIRERTRDRIYGSVKEKE